jgi:hypothetical protein
VCVARKLYACSLGKAKQMVDSVRPGFWRNQEANPMLAPFRGHGIVVQDWITTDGHHQFRT